MQTDLAQEAIQAALHNDWIKAVDLNLKLIKTKPDDIDALNRIARAYAETGDLERARKMTDKVLKLDPTNPIASRCKDKWNGFQGNGINTKKVSANDFIEEPTKTKIVDLINLGEIATIKSLNCGDYLVLNVHTHRVNVTTQNDKYVGRFPDNIAFKFVSLSKLGGSYDAVVKSATDSEVKIFVKPS